MIRIVALFAVVLTTAGWGPQLARTVRSRSADDFSWGYLAMTATGVGCWLTYGLLREDVALAGANSIALTALLFIAAVKTRPGRSRRRRSDACPSAVGPVPR